MASQLARADTQKKKLSGKTHLKHTSLGSEELRWVNFSLAKAHAQHTSAYCIFSERRITDHTFDFPEPHLFLDWNKRQSMIAVDLHKGKYVGCRQSRFAGDCWVPEFDPVMTLSGLGAWVLKALVVTHFNPTWSLDKSRTFPLVQRTVEMHIWWLETEERVLFTCIHAIQFTDPRQMPTKLDCHINTTRQRSEWRKSPTELLEPK
jgi:hypothetical protein